jgi:hypothetical protein
VHPQLRHFHNLNWTKKLGEDVDNWIVPNWIPKDGLAVLASAPKTGKTCLASAMASAIVTGGEFLGHKLEPGPVLWCAHEETPYERYVYTKDLPDDAPLYTGFSYDLPTLDARAQDFVVDRYGRYEENEEPGIFIDAITVSAKLIVIDCLHAAVRSWNLADNNAARRLMGRLRAYSAYYHVGVLVLHHVTKSATRGYYPERFADSAQILASASCHHFLESRQESDGTRRLTVHSQGRHPEPPACQLIHSPDLYTFNLLDGDGEKAKEPTATSKVINLLQDSWELSPIEIAKALDLKPNTVRKVISDLFLSGTVERADTVNRHNRYRLVSPE